MILIFDAYNFPTAVGKIDDMPMYSLPWGHNALILERSKSLEESIWYSKDYNEKIK